MPQYQTLDDDGDDVKRYRWHAEYVPCAAAIPARLREWRREAIGLQEDCAAMQKACGAADRDSARFFSAEAKRHLRTVRAITLAIPYFGEPDKAQEPERPMLWPLDLSSEMDDIAGRLRLEFG